MTADFFVTAALLWSFILGEPKGFVTMGPLKDAIQKDEWRVNNLYDNKIPHYQPKKILYLAYQLIGHNEYHLLRSNCEHFSAYCRYGIKRSEQSRTTSVLSKIAHMPGLLAVSAIGH